MSFERIIGLDVGTKRIGIAMSDPLLITAQPLKTISRQPEKKALEEIHGLCSDYNVKEIIIGLPKNMNGTLGPQAEDCQEFGSKLSELTNISPRFEDERLTSKQAETYLQMQNQKYTKKKGLVDVASAAIILQQYLDKRR